MYNQELEFLETILKEGKNSKQLTDPTLIRRSVKMLEQLPSTRDIVFEYFAMVIDIAVHDYFATANIDMQTGLLIQSPQSIKNNATNSTNNSGINTNGNPNTNSTTGGSSSSGQNPDDDKDFITFTPIQEALENLVLNGPAIWRPFIANWCLDFVAKLSEKYTKRKMTIMIACNYWLNCDAIRGLLLTTSICFQKFDTTESETCVQTLLNILHRYPSSFDWVVARLGGCFPNRIMTHILQCSLKGFSDDFRYRIDTDVGILEFLALTHEQELRNVLREMLQDGFQPKKNLDATILPFILVLATRSDVILANAVNVFIEMFDENLISTIVQRAPLWMSNKVFADMLPTFNSIILRMKSKGANILMLVATMAHEYTWCQDFLESSLQELEQIVLNVHICPFMDSLPKSMHMLWELSVSDKIYEQQTSVRLLLTVATQLPVLYYDTINQLLRKNYIENPNGIGALIRILAGYDGLVEFPNALPGFLMVLEDIYMKEQLKFLDDPFEIGSSESVNTFRNFNTLIRMQKKNNNTYLNKIEIVRTLNECLLKILQIFEVTLKYLLLLMDKEAEDKNKIKLNFESELGIVKNEFDFDDVATNKILNAESGFLKRNPNENKQNEQRNAQRLELCHLIIELLNAIDAGAKTNLMNTPVVLKLSQLTVKYFFVSLSEKNVLKRAKATNHAYLLLQRQCSARKAARTACLRELVEGALFYYGYLFGQNEEAHVDELKIPTHELVLVQNQRQCDGPNVNRAVLHAGVIGRGLRNDPAVYEIRCDPVMQSLLLKALNSCCTDTDKQSANDGYVMISLLLVEMVSPDVMYNGLPFPEEEFTKVTIERDLMIRRAFTTAPILWAFLGFIATHRSALCFTSVLLRALCATCLHQWRAKNVNKFHKLDKNDELYICTKQLLEVLAMGQLLPPPLSSLHLVIEHLDPLEIALLLKECVWNYLKDNVPSPAMFQNDSNGLHWRNPAVSKVLPQYIDTLRSLMQKKLTKLGSLYHQMFIMSEMHGNSSSNSSCSSGNASNNIAINNEATNTNDDNKMDTTPAV